MAYKRISPMPIVEGGTARSTLTAHNVLLGEGTSAVGLVAPSATAGVPLVSAGAAVDPSFGTAVVAGGGTGVTTTTAYAVLCGGTTSTGALQSVASVGTTGQVLTSNGAAALPTFQTSPAFTSMYQTVYTSGSGTHTFQTGYKYALIEASGGGGGGRSVPATTNFTGGGGGAGGYARALFTAATLGSSISYAVGAGGAADAAGGNTTIGSVITCNGGSTGAAAAAFFSPGGNGGTASVSSQVGNAIALTGGAGDGGINGSITWQGGGGGNLLTQRIAVFANSGPQNANGITGVLYGGGGGPSSSAGLARSGGAGASGVIIITEYI